MNVKIKRRMWCCRPYIPSSFVRWAQNNDKKCDIYMQASEMQNMYGNVCNPVLYATRERDAEEGWTVCMQTM